MTGISITNKAANITTSIRLLALHGSAIHVQSGFGKAFSFRFYLKVGGPVPLWEKIA